MFKDRVTHDISFHVERSNTSINDIRDHNGMTPLHILALNPYADSGSLVACFEANMNAVFEDDNINNTPLDYLRKYNVEGFYVSCVNYAAIGMLF